MTAARQGLATVLNLTLVAAFAAVLLFGALSTAAFDLNVRGESTLPGTAEFEANAVVAEHGCWSGPAPADMAGKVPGHVVVTLEGSDKPVYSARLVGPALDKVFGAAKPGAQAMTVRAFCR